MTRNPLSASALLAVVLVLFGSVGCALQRHREWVREGVLIRGLHRDAFLEEWGRPDRTYTITGDEAMNAAWAGGTGFFFKGKAVYDAWEYLSRDTTLVFSNAKLVTWKTTKTTEELKTGQ
jgi:hypothetical protein